MTKEPVSSLTNRSLRKAVKILCTSEPLFHEVIEQYGSPPLWDRPPGFATMLRIILEQQVSLASARAVYERLLVRLTTLTADNFLSLDDTELLALGFSRQKRRYCRHLAFAIRDGNLNLDDHHSNDDAKFRKQLMQIKGIGQWTVDIYFLMALKRPDIWPQNDLALAQAMQNLFGLPERPDLDMMQSFSENWKPWRAAAARILWHYYLSQRQAKHKST